MRTFIGGGLILVFACSPDVSLADSVSPKMNFTTVRPYPDLTHADPATRKKLATTVVASHNGALSDILEFYADTENLTFEFNPKAFKDAGMDVTTLLKIEIQAKGQNIPLSQMLTDILAQVGCAYDVKADTIVVRPAK